MWSMETSVLFDPRGPGPHIVDPASVPVTLVLVTFLIGWILVLPPVDSFPEAVANPRWLLALSPNATPVTFAFLGAYFFSMQMLFRRYVRGDLRGSAYVAVVLRVVLAVVGIWVLQGVGEEGGWTSQSQLLVLAFVIGVFPVVVWQVISGAASKMFDVRGCRPSSPGCPSTSWTGLLSGTKQGWRRKT